MLALSPVVSGGVMDLVNWEETPVGGAHIKMTEFAFMQRPDWKKADTDQIAAYICHRYRDGSPTTRSWFDSAELFRAAYVLALRYPVASEDRRKWQHIALVAAKRSISQDPETIYIAFDCVLDLKAGDKYLCSKLVEVFEDTLATASHPAIPLFSIYCVYSTIGDTDCARDALEYAYQLCPKDALVAGHIVRSRRDDGQVSRAREVVFGRDSGATSAEETLRLASLAQNDQAIAEQYVTEDNPEEARKALERAWSNLQRIRELRRGGNIVIPPTLCLQRNRCATDIGLIVYDRGNPAQAIHWLKASLTDGPFVKMLGYDLRLAEKLMRNPSERDMVIRYLEVARKCGPMHINVRASKLLQDLKASDGPPLSENAAK